MKPQPITESTFNDPSTPMAVDEAQHVIRHVKALGRSSKNGRTYVDRALQDAAGFYEGIVVNVDHPDPDAPHEPRRINEGFGVLRDVKVEAAGVFGDLHYLEAHPSAPVIIERAKRFPETFGLSHNAAGQVREADDGTLIVEGLASVESVDIVSRPATTAGLFESDRSRPVKTKPTIKKVLEANAKDKDAARLLLLLEEEDMAAVGELPAETEPDAGEAIRQAFKKIIMAVLDDTEISWQEAKAKVGKALQKREQTLKGLDTETAAGGDTQDTDEEDDQVPAMESFNKRLTAFEHRQGVNDLLEDKGLKRTDLSAAQLKLVRDASTLEVAEQLLESWEITPATADRPRPAMPPARQSANDPDTNKSFEDLVEQIGVKPKK